MGPERSSQLGMGIIYLKHVISEVRPAGLADGLRVGGEMESFMIERNKNESFLIWPRHLTSWRCHAIKWDGAK